MCLGEGVVSVLDNLDRAARLGLLAEPSEVWIAARSLRNRMVHEYIRYPAQLPDAVIEKPTMLSLCRFRCGLPEAARTMFRPGDCL